MDRSISIDMRYYELGSIREEAQEEVLLKIPVDIAEVTPWVGFGANRGSILSVVHSDVRYDFFSTHDTRSESGDWRAGVNILKFDELEAQLICEETQNADWIDPIYDAKTSLGQCWNRDMEAWTASCE
jgi:hypothetical protein